MEAIYEVLYNPYTLRLVLLEADYDTIMQACSTYYAASLVCQDKIFWKEKTIKEFKSQAIPQSMEEIANNMMEKIRNRLRPNRELSMATMGMMMTLDRIKPVGTQAISSTEAPRVPCM